MPFRRCFAHCPHGGAVIYPFPPKTDAARRDLWLRQFGKNPEKFPQKHLYACRRHFSSYMTYGRLLQKNAYPDVNLSTYDKDNPYTEKYSYYKSNVKPNQFLHDNFDDAVLVPPKDCGIELEFAPVEYIVPFSNELSHSEDSSSDNDEGKITAQTADEEYNPNSNQVAKQVETPANVKFHRKRICILKCGGKRVLHSLPSIETDFERREKWLYLMGKDPALYTNKHVYVCDLHFDINMVGLSKLIRGAYPNKNLPPPLIKSIPEGLESQTECLQKCTDYRRKFKFPTLDLKMRETWLLKFGRGPAFYKHDIYACDRHFSDEMRVGPYLQAHAVPDQNLKLKILYELNTNNYVSKNWSLERLDALANGTMTSPTHSTTDTTISQTDTTTTTISPTLAAKSPYSSLIHSTPQITPQTCTFSQTAQNENILNQLNMTVIPAASQNPTTPVEYVKMQTLGVFMQHKDGYVVSMKQILNACDPLDCNRYLPMDWAEPIEPKLDIKVHPIPSEIYEGNGEPSEDNTNMPASPTHMDYAVEESFENAHIYNIKQNNVDLGYTTAKKAKFAQAFDEQHNNGEVWSREDNYDYRDSAESAQIYNIKRNNYDLGYTTAKKAKFAQAFDEQHNNGEVWSREDNYDYRDSAESAQIYNIKRNNYDLSYTTAKKAKFAQAFDEQQNSSDLCAHENSYDCDENNVDELNDFSGSDVTGVGVEFAETKGPILDQLVETYPTESFSILLEQNNAVINCGKEIDSESKAEDVIIPDEPRIVDKLLTQKKTETFNKDIIAIQPKQQHTNSKVLTQLKATTNDKGVITVQPKQQHTNSKVLTQLKATTNDKGVITVQPKQQHTNSKVLTQLKAATVDKGVITVQPKQQHNRNCLAKAVALAESWQQVVKTMQRAPRLNMTANSTLAENMQKQPDANALAARKLVEQIKQAGEREKQSIQLNRITGNLMAADINGKQIVKHNEYSTQMTASVATTQAATKKVDNVDPNAFKITSVETINSIQPIISGRLPILQVTPETHDDRDRAKITSVEIINTKQPMYVANGNRIKFTKMRTPQILGNRKEMLQTMQRATATKAINTKTTSATTTTTTTPFERTTTTTTPFEITSTISQDQSETMNYTIDELLAKAKSILNTNNTEAPANTSKLILCNTPDDEDDDSLKYAETEICFAPTTNTQNAEDNDVVPFCVLKCANVRKLYEFPTPEAQTFQRHFWFMQLGLDIAVDWQKALYICDKHFEDSMFLPPDNTLNEYAYPCKSLMRQINEPTTTVGTQTCDDGVEYKGKLLDQLAEMQKTISQQKLELKRVKVLIRLKQEAARLVAEIEEEKNASKPSTIYKK